MKKAINGVFLALLAGSIIILTSYAVYVFACGLTDIGWLLVACNIVAIGDFICLGQEDTLFQ